MYKKIMELSAKTIERMRQYLKEAPQHKHGKHQYTLEQFDLNEEMLRERFARYYKRFGL